MSTTSATNQRAIVLVYRAKHADGWKFHTVPINSFGSPDLDAMSADVLMLPGKFLLRTVVNRKPVYSNIDGITQPATTTREWFARREVVLAAYAVATGAEQKRAKKAAEAEAAGLPVPVAAPVTKKESLHLFEKAAEAYVAFTSGEGHKEAARDAKFVLAEFKREAGITYTKDTPALLNKYRAWLRTSGRNGRQTRMQAVQGNGSSERTVKNKTMRVLAFCKFAKVDVSEEVFDKKKAMKKTASEKKDPVIYTPEQIDTLLTAIDGDTQLRLSVLLMLRGGLRELEAAHALWSNIDWKHSTYSVRAVAAFDWQIKDKEERTLPLDAALLAELKAWRESNPDTKLIVGTASDKPNFHLLRAVKRAVRSSGFNCGECVGCTGKTKECSIYTLHGLRRTYITKLIRSGFDIATIQKYVGHSDLASTMRYLAAEAARNKQAQDRINTVNWEE